MDATLTLTSTENRGNAIAFNKKGLFIGGAAKSGTTLLVSLLDNHPQLVVLPEETAYLEHRAEYNKLGNQQDKLRRLLGTLKMLGLQAKYYDETPGCSADARNYAGFDWERFLALVEEFTGQPGMNDSLLLTEVIRAYGIVAGADCGKCVRWVEKTPRT